MTRGLALTLLTGTGICLTPVALAMEGPNPSAQHRLADAAFLTQAAALHVPAAVCVVDSGVTENPDLAGAIAGRISTSGGTLDDVAEHGTYVAMAAVARVNDWGMVGAWPAGHVFSVRIRNADGTGDNGIYRGISECIRARQQGINIAVIELAFSTPGPADDPGVVDMVQRARARGMSVVAAAGNGEGAPVESPANAAPAIAVGSAAADGTLCPHTSQGPELDLLVLGCGMDIANPTSGLAATGSGTSLASAFAAGVLAALRDARPDLSVERAERLLIDTARPTAAGRLLDAAAAFRAAGRGDLVDAYRPPAAESPTIPGSPGAQPSGSPPAQRIHTATCAPPRWCLIPSLLSVERRNHRLLVLELERVPRGSRVHVRVDGRLVARARRTTVRVRIGRRFKSLTVRFEHPRRGPSQPLVLTKTLLDG